MRRMKRITLKQDIPKTTYDHVYEFIKKEKQVSYRSLKDHWKKVPESTLRRTLENLEADNTIERQRCLCGQGFIWQLKKHEIFKSRKLIRKKK